MRAVALDIETIPDEMQLAHLAGAGFDESEVALGNTKDPEKVASKIAEARDKFLAGLVKKCSFNPLYGQLACVACWDGQTGGTLHLQEFKGDEAAMLRALFEYLKNVDAIITWNGVGFDWRFIKLRAAMLGIRPPRSYDTLRYHNWPDIDLMQILADWDKDKWVSLAEACRLFGVSCPGKESGMRGDQVYDYCQEGRWDEVASYCLSDARATWDLFVRFRACGLVPVELTSTLKKAG